MWVRRTVSVKCKMISYYTEVGCFLNEHHYLTYTYIFSLGLICINSYIHTLCVIDLLKPLIFPAHNHSALTSTCESGISSSQASLDVFVVCLCCQTAGFFISCLLREVTHWFRFYIGFRLWVRWMGDSDLGSVLVLHPLHCTRTGQSLNSGSEWCSVSRNYGNQGFCTEVTHLWYSFSTYIVPVPGPNLNPFHMFSTVLCWKNWFCPVYLMVLNQERLNISGKRAGWWCHQVKFSKQQQLSPSRLMW